MLTRRRGHSRISSVIDFSTPPINHRTTVTSINPSPTLTPPTLTLSTPTPTPTPTLTPQTSISSSPAPPNLTASTNQNKDDPLVQLANMNTSPRPHKVNTRNMTNSFVISNTNPRTHIE